LATSPSYVLLLLATCRFYDYDYDFIYYQDFHKTTMISGKLHRVLSQVASHRRAAVLMGTSIAVGSFAAPPATSVTPKAGFIGLCTGERTGSVHDYSILRGLLPSNPIIVIHLLRQLFIEIHLLRPLRHLQSPSPHPLDDTSNGQRTQQGLWLR
jgi:hypothetical protein